MFSFFVFFKKKSDLYSSGCLKDIVRMSTKSLWLTKTIFTWLTEVRKIYAKYAKYIYCIILYLLYCSAFLFWLVYQWSETSSMDCLIWIYRELYCRCNYEYDWDLRYYFGSTVVLEISAYLIWLIVLLKISITGTVVIPWLPIPRWKGYRYSWKTLPMTCSLVESPLIF